jgi:long-chain acyl-CoA synthetase
MTENLWSLVNTAFNKFPDNTIWVRRLSKGRRESFTYAQVQAAANALAEQLRELGVRAGDHVGILSENGPEWGAAAFATWKLGAVAAPLHTGNSDEELHSMVQALSPRLILFHGNDRGLPNVIPIELRAGASPPSDDSDLAGSNAEAVRLYTSGSTGQPKLVRLSHGNIISNVLAGVATDLDIRSDDRFLSLLPSSHAFGLSFDMLLPIYCGACIVLPRVLGASEILTAMAEERISMMIAVPRLFRNVMQGMEKKFSEAGPAMQLYLRLVRCSPPWLRARLNWPIRKKFGGHIKAWVSGGSRLDPEISSYYRCLGLPLRQGYGLTETSPALSVQSGTDDVLDSVGEPLVGVEVKLKDPDETGSGILMVRGPNLMLGYADEKQTAEVMEDGWFNTGDIAKLVDGKKIVLVGRAKRLIVTEAGKNVYPEDLEIMLERYPEIKEAGVFELDARPAVVFAVEVDDEAGVKDILRQFNARVSGHNQIARYAVVEELPRTPLGKVALRELPDIFSANEVT